MCLYVLKSGCYNSMCILCVWTYALTEGLCSVNAPVLSDHIVRQCLGVCE